MTGRFQLVFRSRDIERAETHETNSDGEPHVDGKLILDGRTYVILGVDWLLTADDSGDTKRFLCTLVTEPAHPGEGT